MALAVSERLRQVLVATLEKCRADGLFEGELPEVPIERPKKAEHGDFATTVALALAKRAKKNPREVAELVRKNLVDPDGLVASADIAGPGFLNVRIADRVWRATLGEVLSRGADYGRGKASSAERILVEYVSANPTGPLHVGHGRCAAIGDGVARLLTFAGYSVAREFYVNDAGNQVFNFARSVWLRYMQARGHDLPFPEKDVYHGDYVRELGQELAQRDGAKWEGLAQTAEALTPIREFALDKMLAWQRQTLAAFRCEFDKWFSERSLFSSGAVEQTLAELRERGHLYEKEGAVFFKSQELGGDHRDRVIIKSTGEKTYLAGDAAYHRDKLKRGFGLLINIFGQDHIDHVPGLKASVAAFGHDPKSIEVLLYAFVRLMRGGEEVKMSKRSGEYVLLDDLIEWIGVDATRFYFLTRRHDTHIEFDIEVAKRQSMDNPVYYAQYGHARCAAILRRAAELGIEAPAAFDEKLAEKLALPEELAMLQRLASFPQLVQDAAAAREPHRLIIFLSELAGEFQSYYTQLQKVHNDTILPQARHRAQAGWEAGWDFDKTRARLMWVRGIKQVMQTTLTLLGISAPEQMSRDADEEPAEA
jgi:arginyl-tRNA synthetase